MNWSIVGAMAVRPLVLIALFFTATTLARKIMRRVPAGKLRSVLMHRFPITPLPGEKVTWWPTIFYFAWFAAMCIGISRNH